MNPLNNNQNLWGSWSYNDSTDNESDGNSPQPRRIYPPGNPPPQKPDTEIKDWPSVAFGD